MVKFQISGVDRDNHINWIRLKKNMWWQHGGSGGEDYVQVAIRMFSSIGHRQAIMDALAKSNDTRRDDAFAYSLARYNATLQDDALRMANDYFHIGPPSIDLDAY